MALVQHDHMVQTLLANGPHDALGDRVGFGRLDRGQQGANAEASRPADEAGRYEVAALESWGEAGVIGGLRIQVLNCRCGAPAAE